MRETLNSNPLAQAALIGVLLIGVAFLLLGGIGGGGGSGASSTSSDAAVSTSPTDSAGSVATPDSAAVASAAVGVPSATPSVPAPPLPHAITAAYRSDRIVVLLVVREGGVDDRLVARSVRGLSAVPEVSSFVVSARRIARYAAITQGVSVDRVPALVVLRQRSLTKGSPEASISYGFQSPQSVVQAVRDAVYKGPAATYNPN